MCSVKDGDSNMQAAGNAETESDRNLGLRLSTLLELFFWELVKNCGKEQASLGPPGTRMKDEPKTAIAISVLV